jgi:hypothetical protein
LQSAITTVFYYFTGTVSSNSLVLRDILRALTVESGYPVMLRTLVPCKSTVVVLDVFVDVDERSLIMACSKEVVASCVLDDDVTGEPDEGENVHVRPVWAHVATGVNPPEEILLSDSFQTTPELPSVMCGATTRTNKLCRLKTKHASGLCWRHRLGK